MSYKIIVASYNCYDQIKECVQSIYRQRKTYEKFDVCIVDDASTDERQPEFLAGFCKMAGFHFLRNGENTGALYSQVRAIKEMNCDDDDVIVFLDGDDKFSHDEVISHLARYYKRTDPLLTYGNYRPVPASKTCMRPRPYPLSCVQENDYRDFARYSIRFNHLRTVKWKVAKHLAEEDFLDADGSWYHVAGDTAFMIPCLELAGGRYTCIDEVFVDYTSDLPQADWRLNTPEIHRIHKRISRQPKKEPIA